MTPAQHQKLAALRRMADHASTPENERTSAKRRIAEMEEKYGTDHTRDYTFNRSGQFTVTIEHVEFTRPQYEEVGERAYAQGNMPPCPFMREDPAGIPRTYKEVCDRLKDWWKRQGVSADPPFGNCRCRTVHPVDDDQPVDTEAPFSGTRLSEFADYILSQWTTIFATKLHPGPYGRVGYVARDQTTNDEALFVWLCPQCRRRVQYSVGWREAGRARADQKVMNQLVARLSSIWAGYEDNRCSGCIRFERFSTKEEDDGNSSSDGEG